MFLRRRHARGPGVEVDGCLYYHQTADESASSASNRRAFKSDKAFLQPDRDTGELWERAEGSCEEATLLNRPADEHRPLSSSHTPGTPSTLSPSLSASVELVKRLASLDFLPGPGVLLSPLFGSSSRTRPIVCMEEPIACLDDSPQEEGGGGGIAAAPSDSSTSPPSSSLPQASSPNYSSSSGFAVHFGLICVLGYIALALVWTLRYVIVFGVVVWIVFSKPANRVLLRHFLTSALHWLVPDDTVDLAASPLNSHRPHSNPPLHAANGQGAGTTTVASMWMSLAKSLFGEQDLGQQQGSPNCQHEPSSSTARADATAYGQQREGLSRGPWAWAASSSASSFSTSSPFGRLGESARSVLPAFFMRRGAGGGGGGCEIGEKKELATVPHLLLHPDDVHAGRLECPITQELMQDPVVAADGFTYERSAIERWIAQSTGRVALSPMTGNALTSHELVPNLTLRSLIAEYTETEKQNVKKKKWKMKKIIPTVDGSAFN